MKHSTPTAVTLLAATAGMEKRNETLQRLHPRFNKSWPFAHVRVGIHELRLQAGARVRITAFDVQSESESMGEEA
ncbi:hypothetical protein [Caballeronia sp. GaOx3]|uniref:hypothetical protein n=1 Tax=Caballeronia sp. GaOx3 TaxID=2921740 RepID=UPI002028C1E1|nr:hypothetical protein [Caballeronia sp. GaOx3]